MKVNNFYFRDLGTLIADEIHKRMSKTNPMLDDAVLIGIHEICRKTVEDLKVVLGELEEFQQKVVPISQNKRKNTVLIYFVKKML